MGKALTLIGIWVFINIVTLLIALGVGAVDPDSQLLFGNAILGSDDLIGVNIETNSSTTNTWTFNNTLKDKLPQGSATQTGTTGSSAFPDWINSSLNWLKDIVSFLFNIVGLPYTLCIWLAGPGSLAAVIGSGLAIMNLFILVNWIFGKID